MLCNGTVIVIVEYDRRRPGIYSKPLDMEYDNNITEESTAISLNMDINMNMNMNTSIQSINQSISQSINPLFFSFL